MRSIKTYDPKSYELAEHFLQDEPCRDDPVLYAKHADDLAKTIQQAIEDWFVTPETAGALPSVPSATRAES